MKLNEKVRHLREVEGSLRNLDRPMTQGEMVRALREEIGESLSQSYLSQIESGARPHLTNTTRMLLARFFRVHPGYLVDDPEGFHAELSASPHQQDELEDKLDLWLIAGAERFRKDPELCRALLALARHDDSRRCLLSIERVLATPQRAARLFDGVGPQAADQGASEPGTASTSAKRNAPDRTQTGSLR